MYSPPGSDVKPGELLDGAAILGRSCITRAEHRLQSGTPTALSGAQGHSETDLMHIRLVSSLTADDEARVAAALCIVVRSLLDQFGIAYTLRVETTDGQIFEERACDELRRPARDLAAN